MNHIETNKPSEKKWTVTFIAVTVFAAIAVTFALVLVLYQQQGAPTASEKSLVFFDRSQPLSQHPFIDLSSIELAPSDHALLSSFKQPAELTCHLPPATPRDRRRDKNLLRVVNFNPEWLFQFGGGGKSQCPGNGCSWKVQTSYLILCSTGKTPEMSLLHLKRVAVILARLDADIIHLDEVESCSTLELLLQLLPPKHGYRAYLSPGKDTATGGDQFLFCRTKHGTAHPHRPCAPSVEDKQASRISTFQYKVLCRKEHRPG